MKKYLTLILLVSIFLIAACSEQAPEQTIETPITETPIAQINSVCGDGTCDNDEMCIISTLQTLCQADCGPCPSRIYVEPFKCGDSNCEITGNNEFTLKIPASIKVNIANLGETLANTMEVGYKCYENNQRVIQHALIKNYKGTLFEDSFDNEKDEIRLTARGSTGSKTTYTLSLKKWTQSTFENSDLICNFEFDTHSPIKNNLQTVTIKVRE
ncbi:MAG: hypothetical protein KJ623_03295 [Nanoarchaeota archaeon]|nr:hypothetical protein [Nanoarchaeota archaeon]